MQLTLNFDAGITDCYSTCVEYSQHCLHTCGKQQKVVAADMDLSPGHLSRKLSQSPNDTMKFTVDDLESYITTTNDKRPLLYLVEKYLADEQYEKEQLKAEIAKLTKQLEAR